MTCTGSRSGHCHGAPGGAANPTVASLADVDAAANSQVDFRAPGA
jgi:hypothetical protein